MVFGGDRGVLNRVSGGSLVEAKSLEGVLCQHTPCVRSPYAILTRGYAVLD